MLVALPDRYSVLFWAFQTADARHMPRLVWAAAPTRTDQTGPLCREFRRNA